MIPDQQNETNGLWSGWLKRVMVNEMKLSYYTLPSSSHDYTRVIYLVDAFFIPSYQAFDGS